MPDSQSDVLFEFTAIGTVVRVAAIHVATGTEVTVMGPTSASRKDLERLALQKLKARIAREAR
jgi:hypothetical protein